MDPDRAEAEMVKMTAEQCAEAAVEAGTPPAYVVDALLSAVVVLARAHPSLRRRGVTWLVARLRLYQLSHPVESLGGNVGDYAVTRAAGDGRYRAYAAVVDAAVGKLNVYGRVVGQADFGYENHEDAVAACGYEVVA